MERGGRPPLGAFALRLVVIGVVTLSCRPATLKHAAAGRRPEAREPARDEGGQRRAVFAIDSEGVAAWLACRKRGESSSECARRSGRTLGGQIARISRSTFGPDEHLDIEGLSTEAVAALARSIASWDLARQTREVRELFAEPMEGKIRIFVVANGHRWGDAYVRRVVFGEGGPTLSDRGEPVVVLNAVNIAASYGDSPQQQARQTLGVVKHEIFHVLFGWYRQRDPGWRKLARAGDRTRAFAVQVLNEGIAHFIHRRFLGKPLPLPKVRASLARLDRAVRQLAAQTTDRATADNLVRGAFQGKYWDKFGAISGMTMAYGIHRTLGADGLRRAIRCGPATFVDLYTEASRKHADFAPPSSTIRQSFGRDDACH